MGWSCEVYLLGFVKSHVSHVRDAQHLLVPCLDEGNATADGAEDFVTAGRRRRCSADGTVRGNASELCRRSAWRGGR